MRNTKALIMVFIALLFGLAAVVIAGKWLVGQVEHVDADVVLVASHDLDVGTRLSGAMLERVDWPSANRPNGAFSDAALLEGRVLKSNLVKNELVLELKLAPEGTSGGLSGVIGEGKRAITVRVNDVIGVAGFALPGNQVDILVNARDEDRKSFSRIVLEQILVLAVAQDVGRDDTQPKVVTAVTLEVSPQEAETLDLARSIGSLSLVLRNQMDDSNVDTEGRRVSDLLNESITEVVSLPDEPKVVYVEHEPKILSVLVIRGSYQSEVELMQGNNNK